MTTLLRCPKCGHDDRIQKVSSVYSDGVVSGSYSGPSTGVNVPLGKGRSTMSHSYTHLSGMSQSLLSQRLAPPKEPAKPGGCGSCLTKTGGVLLMLCAAGAIVGGMALVSSSQWYGIAIGMFGALSVCALLVWAGLAVFRRNRKKVDERRRQYEAQVRTWKVAMHQWNALYYCARDDGVFDPDESVFVPPEQMIRHIYTRASVMSAVFDATQQA